MPTTERMKPISLFVPFEPVERQSKDKPLIVSGYCFVNETVEGEGGIVIERAAMQAATPEYRSRGTIREMHGPHAAGVAESVDWDEDGRCHLTAKIVDPVARMKVEEGVYRGFSIKIRPLERMGNRIKVLKWAENSLVDDPADSGCDELLIHRAEGFDPDTEVEVEVLDDPASPAPAADSGGSDAVAASDSLALPTIPPAIAPSAESVPAEGDSSHTETERAALLAAGLPESMLAGVDVVQAQPETERALGSPVVPIRENLAGQPTADVEDVDDALGGGLPGDYRVEQAPTGAWCAYGPAGDKLGEFETEALANAHIAECKRQMGGVGAEDEPARAAAASEVQTSPEQLAEVKRELEAILARVVALTAAPAVEDTPAAPDDEHPTTDTQVSRTDVRDDATVLERLETVTAELSRARMAEKDAVTRLATAEAEVRRLNDLPVREKPVVRYPHALSREFTANLGNEGEARIAVLRADYEAAKTEAEAERNGDRSKLNRALERMILRSSQLAEHGISVS